MAQTLLILFNLFILECLLSVDNAAALAVIVGTLPVEQRRKGLTYGIVGAFVFRGISLFAASWLAQIWGLKLAGGLYLLHLCYSHFKPGKQTLEEGIDPKRNGVFNFFRKRIGVFWATVVMVELMDMVFSMDNVFAAVAITQNIILIYVGIFLGIIAIRFVANWFVDLLGKYPSLEGSSYIVIGLLGFKLIIDGLVYIPRIPIAYWKPVLESNAFNISFSLLMMAIFLYPAIFKRHAV